MSEGSRRRGLGRGLDALLRPEQGVREIEIGRLRPNRFQPRAQFDETGLEELAASIRAQGIVQPLLVRAESDGNFTIVAGERRWRAAQRAGLATVPAVVREVAGDRELLELALVENLQRADLNPAEEAEAFRLLQESFGLSQEEVAVRVGRSRAAVSNTLRLLRLAPEVLDLLRGGRLTAGQARPLVGLAPERQVTLANRTVRSGLSARQVERAAQGASPRRPPAPPEAHAAAAAERLTRLLQARVEIVRRRRGGEVRIHFHSEEELIRLFDLLAAKGGPTR
ncbi:MAG: ParB/RepB/Spo0J family partition protein [Acidobacteria bacterium]|jgi:ParB family chromosome partitioning protein|nr:ParB/RepB/Spo0J family partition protein [Acidobacteriota bacterium]OQC36571.1 MAG: Chromosome-partitioning protein Spo0J [Acidobacteria bacterium ADurb.Bin051]